jgi:hypothetical protein
MRCTHIQTEAVYQLIACNYRHIIYTYKYTQTQTDRQTHTHIRILMYMVSTSTKGRKQGGQRSNNKDNMVSTYYTHTQILTYMLSTHIKGRQQGGQSSNDKKGKRNTSNGEDHNTNLGRAWQTRILDPGGQEGCLEISRARCRRLKNKNLMGRSENKSVQERRRDVNKPNVSLTPRPPLKKRHIEK